MFLKETPRAANARLQTPGTDVQQNDTDVGFPGRPVAVRYFRSESIPKILSSIPRILNQKKKEYLKSCQKYLIFIDVYGK